MLTSNIEGYRQHMIIHKYVITMIFFRLSQLLGGVIAPIAPPPPFGYVPELRHILVDTLLSEYVINSAIETQLLDADFPLSFNFSAISNIANISVVFGDVLVVHDTICL